MCPQKMRGPPLTWAKDICHLRYHKDKMYMPRPFSIPLPKGQHAQALIFPSHCHWRILSASASLIFLIYTFISLFYGTLQSFVTFICICVYMHGHTLAVAHTLRSEENLLSPFTTWDPGSNSGCRFGRKHLYSQRHPMKSLWGTFVPRLD